MISEKHIQNAGDNAKQIQINKVEIQNTGITEERVREIYAEMTGVARRDYSQEAFEKAIKRIAMLEELLMLKVEKVDGMMESFADPGFQFLLADAQKKAAATERETDYELLSELLACRVQKGENRKYRAGISYAVKIVDEIDDDALCALTVAHALSYYIPVSGNCVEGLSVLNELYGKMMYQELPGGKDWLDHLDVLGAIRLSSFGSKKTISDYFSSRLEGYACVGIAKESEDFQLAIDILNEARINPEFLIDNECLEGYVRLGIRNCEAIEELGFYKGEERITISTEQRAAVKKVWDMYSQDGTLRVEAKKNFMEIWDSFEALREARIWWEAIPNAFDITQVGRVLAHTNAKRINPELPDLI